MEHKVSAAKHVSLDTQGEAVRQFFLSLSVDPEGSVVELNGHALARVTPMGNGINGNAEEGGPWTVAKANRRGFLVDRKIDGTLTPEEAGELAALQKQMIRERERLAPVPLATLRQLHQQLLAKAQGEAGHDGP
jgi:hypothetical protein